jgi:hypothetical protein
MRSLAEVGKFPKVGDRLEVRDRITHVQIAIAEVIGADATHLTVRSRLTTIENAPPWEYRIDRPAWARKCQSPSTVHQKTRRDPA